MQIELDEQILQRLQALADQQGRKLEEVVHEAIESYLSHETDRERYRAKIRRYMQEHTWLLDELARR